MQGLADGYFVVPYTMGNYLGRHGHEIKSKPINEQTPEVVAAMQSVNERTERLLSVKGTRSPDSFHKELGRIMWDNCGMSRSEEGLAGTRKDPAITRRVLE